MAKKKRREIEEETNNGAQNDVSIANGDFESHEKHPKEKKKHREKEKARKKDTVSLQKEMSTVSIAVPGSIINNAQSFELATRVVVFDNKSTLEDDSTHMVENNTDEDETGAAFLIRILSYLETPQYLRKGLFAKHNSLRFVGLLPPLDAPHHLRKHEWASYREGITLKNQDQGSVGTLVDVGLSKVRFILVSCSCY
ncbi:putative methyltransferase C9orf114 homolog isoform X2 [Olea europaea var. sylvestris]|uniref:putative methyltransferase C9orf114 homolog isoform X2 n=1 Tax=Olea europaea var. sylvestris TaxID=158386 RepID=UPI000C1CDC40|nr:putative methyltransferase C9orf114 homolog isoform X2 [Olea europaea var. sylvestris]